MLRLGICGLPLEQIHFPVPLLEADRRAVEAEMADGQHEYPMTRQVALLFWFLKKNQLPTSPSTLGGRRPGSESGLVPGWLGDLQQSLTFIYLFIFNYDIIDI